MDEDMVFSLTRGEDVKDVVLVVVLMGVHLFTVNIAKGKITQSTCVSRSMAISELHS